MGLFSRKKTETKAASPASGRIKVLGSGCAKCHELADHTQEALNALHIQDGVEHVTDFAKIASYGVMSTPALVVDEKVVSSGRVLTTDEVKKLLQK
ncbi:thioredoxin family protein [Acidaminococcus sp. NSJ-142]|jgi:small redox-active disulfide protein 2|uniref:thioredoxin family protein n=1 Tax=Acidaminococcus TaxID=904 RepID=UPI000CF863EE|nr:MULTISPECIES: thioredoxin family protein [Acidaminococcus]MCD2434759.1 thioredoxin family protein [Acidaminococcus hominis]MCH4095396.1 thioredoxin family protein [Acidaminococcus provencensis]RHK03313.1 thioredoxin family protein [Acidaminococcus sp. AM05-11]